MDVSYVFSCFSRNTWHHDIEVFSLTAAGELHFHTIPALPSQKDRLTIKNYFKQAHIQSLYIFEHASLFAIFNTLFRDISCRILELKHSASVDNHTLESFILPIKLRPLASDLETLTLDAQRFIAHNSPDMRLFPIAVQKHIQAGTTACLDHYHKKLARCRAHLEHSATPASQYSFAQAWA